MTRLDGEGDLARAVKEREAGDSDEGNRGLEEAV